MCKNIIRITSFVWFIAAWFISNYSYAQNISWLNDKNISGKISADAKPVAGQILQNAKSLNFLSNNWDIKYDRYMIYELIIQNTSEYSVILLSDDEKMGLTLIDSSATVVGVGKEHEHRHYKKVIKSELQSDEKYYVLIGSGTKDKTINFYITATHSIDQSDIILPIKCSKKLKSKFTKGNLNSNSMNFEGKTCEYYDLSKIKLKNNWLRISVESNSFDPIIYVLNSQNDVVAYNDDRSRKDKNSEVTIGSDVEARALVVAT